MKILISWPGHYRDWELGNSMTNAQHAWWLWYGLRTRYGADNIRWIDWNAPVPHDIPEGARLYSHTSWPIGSGGLALQAEVKRRGGTVYAITNDPLYNYVVEHGMYNLHGFQGFDNKRENYDPRNPSWYAQQQKDEFANVDVMFCHTSDVGLELWRGHRPGGKARRDFLKGLRFVPFMSPIDKRAFARHRTEWKPGKFLTMRGTSTRKRQQDFRRLFPDVSTTFPTENWSWHCKHTWLPTVEACAVLAHPSLQEGFPYFAAECLCKGMQLLGGEDWWDGYGQEELIYRQSVDGACDRDNAEKVKLLSSDSPRARELYDFVQERFRSRQDNEWPWVFDNLFCKEPHELPSA